MKTNTEKSSQVEIQSNSTVVLYDAVALFEVTSSISARMKQKVYMDYSTMKALLESLAIKNGYPKTFNHIMFASIDEKSEQQKKFVMSMSDIGIATIGFHYSDLSTQCGNTSTTSCATRIAYTLGTLANAKKDLAVVLVSRDYSLSLPLVSLALSLPKTNSAALAFFGGKLDYRWHARGLLAQESPIVFFNLDDHTNNILDIRQSRMDELPKLVESV